MAHAQVVTVHVAQSDALRAGSAQWGDLAIDLAAVLALLSEEERGQIEVGDRGSLYASGEWPASRILVRSTSTRPDDVAVAVRAAIAVES